MSASSGNSSDQGLTPEQWRRLGASVLALVAGVSIFLKYFLLKDTLEYFPAIVSNSNDTYGEFTAILISVILDCLQLGIAFMLKEGEEGMGFYKGLMYFAWGAEFFAISLSFFVPDPFAPGIEMRYVANVMFQNIWQTVLTGTGIFIIACQFTFIYVLSIGTEKFIDKSQETVGFGTAFMFVLGSFTLCWLMWYLFF